VEGDQAAWDKAVKDGWAPGKALFSLERGGDARHDHSIPGVGRGADDDVARIKPCLKKGDALYFSHGFSIVYREQTGVVAPDFVDVIMVAPKGSGASVARQFPGGQRINASFAVHQDATGRAQERTIAAGDCDWRRAILFPTTFAHEVHSDLTGERGVLMARWPASWKRSTTCSASTATTPSEAFNETVEELTQSLIRLVDKNGMDWMYANCSTTAQRGALDWRHQFRKAVEPVFDWLYESVVSGEQTRIVLKANSAPDYKVKLDAELREMRESEMWQAGAAVRSLRPDNWKK